MRAAIIGVSGYTGLELVKILLNHKKFEITYVGNSEGDTKITTLYPFLRGIIELDVQKADPKEVSKVADIAFLALPHKTSMLFAKDLIEYGVKVVDLSADYRLVLDNYEKYYTRHQDITNLYNSVYGLPEFYKEEIKKAKLVANPGCYPTATLLALLPFAKYLPRFENVFVDAKSGVSGAGKKLNEITSFMNINENMFAYKAFSHRHSPEIEEKMWLISKNIINIKFVPHIIPVTRGMLISIYITLNEDTYIKPLEILREFYKDSKFVRIFDEPVDIKSTAGTNFCDIYAAQSNSALFINSSIDNLLRGASSQAVVNANLMCGYDEDEGIPKLSYMP